ncbi:hypothetical protein [Tenacibaculum sp. C7A-26P2]|uniref:hypothetical protein n=1 Tax=Tenacibaculum sp. C7A-26P2 TaxID=3447504 RepID=UPI003F865AA2
MIDYWSAPSFDDLYQDFITGSIGGKIFMMKKFEKEDTILGKGAVILLQKATSFLLALLKEQYLIDKNAMIGDIKMLLALVEQQKIKELKQRNKKRTQNRIKTQKTKIQLYNILRKHKRIKPMKF